MFYKKWRIFFLTARRPPFWPKIKPPHLGGTYFTPTFSRPPQIPAGKKKSTFWKSDLPARSPTFSTCKSPPSAWKPPTLASRPGVRQEAQFFKIFRWATGASHVFSTSFFLKIFFNGNSSRAVFEPHAKKCIFYKKPENFFVQKVHRKRHFLKDFSCFFGPDARQNPEWF